MAESKNLWGGRFAGKTDPAFAEFNNSFRFDRRLFAPDVLASIAYCQALEDAGVLNAADGSQIRNALNTILERGRTDKNYFDDSNAEDVHSFVESRLIELTGDVGRPLHTGRSRNDQVATDFRLWLRQAFDDLDNTVRDVQIVLLDFAQTLNAEITIAYGVETVARNSRKTERRRKRLAIDCERRSGKRR